MNVRLVSGIVGIIIFGFAGHAQAADDWQYWNGLKLKHALHEQWDAHIKFEQREVDDFSQFGLHNYAPGLVYKPHKHVQYAVGYKFEKEKSGARWKEEHRLAEGGRIGEKPISDITDSPLYYRPM